MLKFAQANPNIKLNFVNGHFAYFYKFKVLTNALAIPLGIKFFDTDFYETVNKKEFKTPEEQKYFYDDVSLKPVIVSFLEKLKSYSDFNFGTFLDDSEFDSYDNFGLFEHLGFEKVFIPLCPLTKEQFKSEGSCKGKNRSLRFKFTCPKYWRDKLGKCHHTCKNPYIEQPRTVNATNMRAYLYLTAII